jgi:ATP-binding cassette, subfamily F, member 3
MIDVRSLQLAFGARDLFKDMSFQLGDRDRLCLAGRNGTGKTTLLKVMAGEIQPDGGQIIRSSDVRIGFLRQHPENMVGATAYEAALHAFAPLLAKAQELEKLHAAMGEGEVSEDDLHRMDELQEDVLRGGYYTAEAETRTVLAGLGFDDEEQNKPMAKLSGGWQMRVSLARVLLQQPTVLFLDEPTNHLDLESILWLEEWLRNHRGSLILISHDRRFVDRTCERLLEIEGGQTVSYPLPYAAYEEDRALRSLQKQKAYARQQDEIEKLERFVARFKAKASKATQAQSKQKMLDRMDRIELDSTVSSIRLKFPEAPPSGAFVFEAENLGKSFVDRDVFSQGGFAIRAGDRCVLTGPNGAGKTTLLRTLLGYEKPTVGEVRLGHNVQVGYFAQYEEPTEEERGFTLVEWMRRCNPKAGDLLIRNLLGAMLFSDDDAFKLFGVLSGGERSRLRLCRLLLQSSNVLVLDEPTNHLDVVSKDLLLQAINDFTGTVIFVSHDREFVESIATRVIQVKGGKITEYPGDWDYYMAKLDSDRQHVKQGDDDGSPSLSKSRPKNEAKVADKPKMAPTPEHLKVAKDAETKGGAKSPSGESATLSYEAKKELEKARRRDEKRRDEVLAHIHKSESRLRELEAAFMKEEVYANPQESQRVAKEKAEVESALTAYFSEWEALEARLQS